MPSTDWTIKFIAQGETTLVDITLNFDNPEALENIIKIGFKEGFTMGLGNLDELLIKIKDKK